MYILYQRTYAYAGRTARELTRVIDRSHHFFGIFSVFCCTSKSLCPVTKMNFVLLITFLLLSATGWFYRVGAFSVWRTSLGQRRQSSPNLCRHTQQDGIFLHSPHGLNGDSSPPPPTGRSQTPLNNIRVIKKHGLPGKPRISPRPWVKDTWSKVLPDIPMENLHPFARTAPIHQPTAAYNIANNTLYMLPGSKVEDRTNTPRAQLTESPPVGYSGKLTESRRATPAKSPRQSPDSIINEEIPPRMNRWSRGPTGSPFGFKTFRPNASYNDRPSPLQN